MKTLLALLTVLGATALVAGSAFAGNGPPSPAFYVDGDVYRTVGTPTDFLGTGAPEHSFDTVYNLQGAQSLNIATAAPGDPGYNGGRWRVVFVTISDYDAALASADAEPAGNGNGVIDSAAELQQAIDDGSAVIDVDHAPVWFECPVIPTRGNGHQ
jgi:hypothetical protein